MKISIIVPSLQGAEFAEPCLAAVRRSIAAAGDCAADHELIVVEGLSPVGKARNEGLRRASGDYVAWVDADDEVAEGWFGEIAVALVERPDAVVFGWRDEGLGRTYSSESQLGGATQDLLLSVIRDSPPFCFLWNKVFRRGLWDGVRFDETLPLMEDFEALPRVARHVRTVKFVPRCLYGYRPSRAGASRREWDGRSAAVFDVAWRRIGDWRGTAYEKASVAFLAGQIGVRYAQLVRDGVPPAADALLQRQLAAVRAHPALFLLNGHVRGLTRIKLLAVLSGWRWPQRLAWALHRVRPEDGGV